MLTAMSDEFNYFNPSLYTQNEREATIPLIRELTREGRMICPHCFVKDGQKHEVSLVNPKDKITHFRHKQGDRTKECSSYRGESDKHLTAKLALVAQLTQDGGYAEIETRKYGETGLFRTPDVTSTFLNGDKHAHEVQVSPITVEALKERTNALRSIGFKHVHWYLIEKNRKDENVNFLIDHFTASAYHLLFDRDGIPSWSIMLQKIHKVLNASTQTSETLSRIDCDKVRWTYHVKADTLAIYIAQQGRHHVIRLPGASSITVPSDAIRDPVSNIAGGIKRWPMLQP